MLILLLLAPLGFASSTPVETLEKASQVTSYVLPGESIPTFYDVRLFIDPSNTNSFTGDVSMRIIPITNTQQIVMHALELDILSINIYSQFERTRNLFDNYTLATDDTQFLTIRLTEPLLSLRPYTVDISYTGRYASNMFGIYVSTYPDQNGNNVNLVTSQLQPTYARRAFPCYDEPALKAVFRTTIYAPPAYNVVRTNMPLRSDLLKPEVNGWVKHEFQDTLLMSSYLIAYLVSNLGYIENSVNPQYRVPFRIYSRPGTQEFAQFALDFGEKNMIALEEYTEFAYEFPKMDKVAVPDFAAGAMENWGLVIYREAALLVQDGVTTTSARRGVASIICHENMHQWFGNEVGPLSWTYTWLNEGFANFFQSFITDLVLPEWRMMDQYLIAMQNVFQSDAVLTVNPMTFEVYTPSQIIGTFNSVAYQKSGSVIRMMQHFLTPEVFRKGLVKYIKNMSRKAAGPPDLYNALQEALNESNHSIPYPLSLVMDRWTTIGGFPVITVRKTAPQSNSFSVRQERFLTDPSLSTLERWHIPLNWVLSTNVDFTDTAPQTWMAPAATATAINVPGLADAEWYIFNKQQTGYYRVNYDTNNWRALAAVLSSSYQSIHLLNRAQLLDDAFNLARNGRLGYEYAFELSRYLEQEDDYIPWAAANAAFSYLTQVLTGTPAFELYQKYLLTLTAPLYTNLAFNAKPEEEHVTAYHRTIILNINCNNGNQDCVSNAQQLLQDYRNNLNQRPNPDVQTTVFCSGLRGGDAENFNFLWQQYLGTQDSTEQSIYLSALGCTSNEERRNFYMNQVVSPTSPVREQNRESILVSVINSGPAGTNAALDFVIENFAQIQPNVQGLTGTTNILNTLANSLTTQEHMDKINAFYERYEDIFSAGERASVAAIREKISATLAWNNQNLATVEDWLRKNFDEDYTVDSANMRIESVVLIVTCALSIFVNLM